MSSFPLEARPKSSLLKFDQTTLADMAAALKYVCQKLPPDRDNPAIRKLIAEQIIATAKDGRIALGDLTDVGLKIANYYLFPPGRSWLKALDR